MHKVQKPLECPAEVVSEGVDAKHFPRVKVVDYQGDLRTGTRRKVQGHSKCMVPTVKHHDND